MKGETRFSKLWIIEEFISPLVMSTRLITCEGRFSTFKACHFLLLAHFEFSRLLNFPFYFWKSLGKMASQVRKNIENPTHSLYHHGLIKMLILAELKKKDQVWEQFIYELSNSHLKSPLGNDPCGPFILDLVDKASSVNASEHQASHLQELAVKSCKKAGPSYTKNS